ncbi:MAG: ATP-binding cassette domain-containing protein [Oscillospiraceae bacterium]|nr:MAG: ATP-binding cassette domain-containing protein [Oscillospiraceae bacterium]
MLELKNVSVIYGRGTVNQRNALDGVSLKADKGDFITVIGSNGAGKSTLLGAIAGSCPVSGGSIILDGEDITRKPEHKRACSIGRLFQNTLAGTAPGMTVEENLGLAYGRGSRRGLGRCISAQDRRLFKERLETLGLGLENMLDVKVGVLSGGQRQAITLLMATMITPKLLLLDEHTAALDPKTAQQVMNITKQVVQRDNITTLMVTHNIAGALSAGNKTLVLNQGRVLTVLEGEKRAQLTPEGLMSLYGEDAAQALSDRMLL